jgi:hypothetical protein
MFTVNNNCGGILTIYDGGNALATIAAGAQAQINALQVTSVACGGVIYCNQTGNFANGPTYNATLVAKSPAFPFNNVLFSDGNPGGNVRYS